MDLLKSLFDRDMPHVPLSTNGPQPESLPLVLTLDHCNRYRPRFDRKTFKTQLKDTNEALAEYMDPQIRDQYRKVKRMNQNLTYGSWAVGILSAVYCDKIGFIRRSFGEKTLKMLIFKISILCLPYFVVEKVLPEAEEEQISELYQNVKTKYRRYKLSGDITQLNPKIELIDSPLGSLN